MNQFLLAFLAVTAVAFVAAVTASSECSEEHSYKMKTCTHYLSHLHHARAIELAAHFDVVCDDAFDEKEQKIECVRVMEDLFPDSFSREDIVSVANSTYARNACYTVLARADRRVSPRCLMTMAGSTSARCLFLHGMGVDGSEAAPCESHICQIFPSYWGNLDQKMRDAGCEPLFYIGESRQRSWDNTELQQEICAAIAEIKPHAIFTHSMGNLILSASILAKHSGCESVRNKQNDWYSVSAPFTGSISAATATNICTSSDLRPVLRALQYCEKDANAPTPSVHSCSAGYISNNNYSAQLDCTGQPADKCVTLISVAQDIAKGQLCGINPQTSSPTPNPESLGLILMSKYIGKLWGVDETTVRHIPFSGNDGMVALQSCKFPNREGYSINPNSSYYILNGNHADSTGRYGKDGETSENKPIQWYLNRVAETKNRWNV